MPVDRINHLDLARPQVETQLFDGIVKGRGSTGNACVKIVRPGLGGWRSKGSKKMADWSGSNCFTKEETRNISVTGYPNFSGSF